MQRYFTSDQKDVPWDEDATNLLYLRYISSFFSSCLTLGYLTQGLYSKKLKFDRMFKMKNISV